MHVSIYIYSFIFKYIPQHIPITLYHLRQSRGVFVSVPPAIEFVDFPSSTPRDVPQDLRIPTVVGMSREKYPHLVQEKPPMYHHYMPLISMILVI